MVEDMVDKSKVDKFLKPNLACLVMADVS